MPATPAVAHANGSLPFVLVGDDRLRAHEAIRALTAVAVEPGESVPPEVDEKVLAWVKREPSLFVEGIPESNSFGVQGACSWGAHRTWWGTWANKLAAIGCFRATKALFDAGVHPDDGQVFERRVVWLPNWNSQPQHLAAVLAHGADPDVIESVEKPGGFRADPNRSVLRVCLERVGRASGSVWRMRESDKSISGSVAASQNPKHTEALRVAIECVQLLLRDGARRMEPVEHDVLWDDGDVMCPKDHDQTAIGMLVDGLNNLKGHPEDRELLEQLCRDLRAVGADVNRPSGPKKLPPCAHAIRNRDIETFKFLLSIGANARGADIAYEARSGLDEVAEAAFRAQVMEAIMHQAGGGRQAHGLVPAARRHKRATV